MLTVQFVHVHPGRAGLPRRVLLLGRGLRGAGGREEGHAAVVRRRLPGAGQLDVPLHGGDQRVEAPFVQVGEQGTVRVDTGDDLGPLQRSGPGRSPGQRVAQQAVQRGLFHDRRVQRHAGHLGRLRHRVQHGDELDLLAGRAQPHRQLVGDGPAEGAAEQQIRSVRPHRADARQVALGQLGDVSRQLLAAQHRRLQRVHRPPGREVRQQRRVRPAESQPRVQTEQRGQVALAAQGEQRGVRVLVVPVLRLPCRQAGGERGGCGCLEQRRR
ncbi:hypothetical protein WKI71_30195 [Streptomyces sp. MS1.AVA.1]|uniref:Uncharacterized protein n=1 Tax=Streptomyces machairae TaxID=3134109 RepID=A0ABU8URD5_9ACTN